MKESLRNENRVVGDEEVVDLLGEEGVEELLRLIVISIRPTPYPY